MKHKIFAYFLALWTVLSLLPVTVLAEQDQTEGTWVIRTSVTGGEDHGCVEPQEIRANAGDIVLLTADPDEGYLVEIEGICNGDPRGLRVEYVGLDTYSVTMPAADVDLKIRFVPAMGDVYGITGTVNDTRWGTLTISRTSAMEGEYVVVEAAPRMGCVLKALNALGTDGGPIKGGYVDTREGVLIFEYCLPNVGLVIEAEFGEDPDSIAWQVMQARERLVSLLGSILDSQAVASRVHAAFCGG